MTQRITARTDIEDAIPTLKALFRDAFGISKESKIGWFSNFIRWQLKDWRGTSLEFSDIHLQELAGVTIDLTEDISLYFHEGFSVSGKVISTTEASTVEEAEQGPSTLMQRELTRYVEDTIDHLFETSEEDNFEDGMESDFSRELASLVKKYGALAMAEISYLINYGRVDSEVASEALRWLARINDPSTYGWRLWLLEKSLSSDSPIVRDGAALGLVAMRDAHATEYIKKAIERESITELRLDLQGALEELEASLDAASIEKDQ
jgi:hypothetical protein